MFRLFRKWFFSLSAALFTPQLFAGQFVIELAEPLALAEISNQSIKLEQSFAAGPDSYAVFAAPGKEELLDFLSQAQVDVEKISEVLFVNSPTLGGGQAASTQPRDGHQVFVIERPIPGVGFFGLEKKRKISKGSNKAIAKLGDIIEWDHSYLTSEGTYCVYRADAPETLREHGALAGAPIGKITPVVHQTH